MIGIIAELLISWLLLRLVERESLESLGLRPNKRRAILLLLGLGFSIVLAGVQFGLKSSIHQNPFVVNQQYSFSQFIEGSWYVFKSVCFEELIFRGALLYILINRIGSSRAIAISSIAFGIYHWFTFGVMGNPVAMMFVLITTGLAGFAWAYAFRRSGTIWLPFAFHLGYNFTSMIIFSSANIGNQLLIKTYVKDPSESSMIVNILMLLFVYAGFPALTFLFVRKLSK